MITLEGRYEPEMEIDQENDWVCIHSDGNWNGLFDRPNSDAEEEMRLDRASFHRNQTAEVIRALIVESPPRREQIVPLIEQLQTLLGEVVRTDAATTSPPKKPEPLAPKLKPRN